LESKLKERLSTDGSTKYAQTWKKKTTPGGAHVLGAHSVKAPQVRQRLYWVADSSGKRRQGFMLDRDQFSCKQRKKIAESLHGFSFVRDALDFDPNHVLPDNGLSLGLARSTIKGYGNAIVPQVAAEFILAFLEALD
jgi:DNA (cytosine-5)-methyltransferase 1